jgi:hypothetical protein
MTAMAVTTIVLIIGGLAWVFAVGRVEQVNWVTRSDALAAVTIEIA